MPKSKQLNFALLGLGKLGTGFYKVYEQKKEQLKVETGIQLNLQKILVKNPQFKRPKNIDPGLITSDLNDIIGDTAIHAVIDVTGSIEPVFSMLKQIIARGIHIISANRTLLASKMHDIADFANINKIFILPEPSLGGGVPIISTLQQDLVANQVYSMVGILSGNSNFILSEMTRNQVSLKSVLKTHNVSKMAESISIVDYEGSDAAQKVSILAAGAFGIDINYLNIYASGISEVSVFDIQCADDFGYEIKLLAILKEHDESFEVHVHPTMVPKNHPLTLIRGDQNAYFMETDLTGEYVIYGRGVGVEASSSIILRDLVAVGNLLRAGATRKSAYSLNWNNKPVLPMEDILSAYYIRFPCLDQPGVVGKITTAMGKSGINLASAHAEINKKRSADTGYVTVLVDEAKESAIHSAIKQIEQLDIIKGRVKLFRILRSEE